MKKLLFLFLSISSVAAMAQPYNGTVIRGVNYTVIANNSSTANLAVGATFTGTITNVTTGEPNIQMSVSTDQPLEVILQQFNDAAGLQPLPQFHYDVLPVIGLNQNINLTGNFFRVVVNNKGIAATTNLNITTTVGLMTMGARNYIAPPLGTDEGQGVRIVPQINWRPSFGRVLGSTWDTEFWGRLILGTGMATSQSAGSGVITSGTTANSETILRSKRSFQGSFILRSQTILSQRIANNNFVVELVDVIGDALAITVNSTTSVTVTIPNNPFTSENVGQFMNIGAPTGFTGVTAVPGRYAIASVAGNNVNFTVAGWATGAGNTGTCSLFGWNYHQLIYTGTTATNVSYDAQRRGWNSGATTATINTTASPGHMAVMTSDDGVASLSDQLVASATALPLTIRASRVVNIADEAADLWLQVRVLNGTTAPASTTTWTIGTMSVENYAAVPASLVNAKAQSNQTSQGVRVDNSVTVTATNLSTNVAQMNGVATAMNNGTASTGTQRVVIASDNTSNTNAFLVTGALPESITDVASAAITATTTTAAFTPTRGPSYSVVIPITAVSGTTPTADFSIEESDDGGTNWFRVWDFERVTATGILRSPQFPLTGNRVRYVQTIAGTTPSFTRAINRLQVNQPGVAVKRRLIDRSISLTTLNSTSPVLNTGGASIIQLVINVGAITTTAPVISLEGSEEATFTNFYTLPVSGLTAVASSTVQTTLVGVSAPFIRAKVTTAGVGVTAGYIAVKAFN